MKRIVDWHLKQWVTDAFRKPLLLRGARQIGKTYAVRHLGSTFPDFVAINFEQQPSLADIFKGDLDPHQIIRELEKRLRLANPIMPGRTLLFFDEVQKVPECIKSLWFFYEQMPELHVIAAGSLLDFAPDKISMPVGRAQSLYMYPVSFLEFLAAQDEDLAVKEILQHEPNEPLSDYLHTKLLSLIGQYVAVGGLPKAIKRWLITRDIYEAFKEQQIVMDFYRQDFGKYATSHQIPYVEKIFDEAPHQLGQKFKYSALSGGFKSRELAPALELLKTARVMHKINRSSGQGIPVGHGSDETAFKIIMLDIALAQTQLGMQMGQWLTDPLQQIANKGTIMEAFVGQEMLAYSDPIQKMRLHYWRREATGSEAAVDYLTQYNQHVIPVEVKGGEGSTLKSMRMFLESHPNSPYGIRFSTHNYSIHDQIHSYPFYAIAKAFMKDPRSYSALI